MLYTIKIIPPPTNQTNEILKSHSIYTTAQSFLQKAVVQKRKCANNKNEPWLTKKTRPPQRGEGERNQV